MCWLQKLVRSSPVTLRWKGPAIAPRVFHFAHRPLSMTELILSKSDILLPNYRGRLLEGVTYNKANNSLLWVDIILAQVHRYFFETSVHEILTLSIQGDSIGTIGLTSDNDKIVLCNKTGVCIGNFKTNEIKQIFTYPENSKLRSNDGKIDPHGNLIVGTMADFPVGGQIPEGSLYKINAKTLEYQTLKTGLKCPNGLGFNKELTKFYWTESPQRKIYVYDYDFEKDVATNEQVFFDLDHHVSQDSVPDGMCTTEKNSVFGALFNESMVVRITPDGNVSTKFKLPAKCITCCTVGGINDDELFITTAHELHEDLSVDIHKETSDLGGYMYRVKLAQPEKEIQYLWGGQI